MTRYTEKELEHLNNEFYKEVEDIVNDVAKGQILKGAEKYEQPYSPDIYTPQEQLYHVMQELRDGQVYAVGLYKTIVRMEAELRELREENEKMRKYFKSVHLEI